MLDEVPEEQDEEHEDRGGEEVVIYAEVGVVGAAEGGDVHAEEAGKAKVLVGTLG